MARAGEIGVIAAIISGSSAAMAQEAAPIPDIAQAMLDVAYESGDPAEIAAVTKAVKAVFADYEIAIEEQSAARVAELTPNKDEDEETSDEVAEQFDSLGVFAVSPWDGKIQASAVFSSGNSENSAVGVAINATREAGDFTHNIKAFFDLGKSGGVTNQKRWGGSYKLDYNFTERSYAYGRLAYEEDEFSGFDYRLFAGAGLGHYIADSDPFKWKVEGGPGFRYSPIDDTREIKKEFAAYGATELDWVIRPGVTFEQDVNVTWTELTTTLQSVSSLTTEVVEGLSTGVAFEYRYETDPPAGRVKTDTIARASVIYGFEETLSPE